MIRNFAILWLLVVIIAAGFLSIRAYKGIHFDTDLMALLPREERDPVLKRVNDAVTKNLSRQVIVLVGAVDKKEAISSSEIMKSRLASSQTIDFSSLNDSKGSLERIANLYFPYRSGLLSLHDRVELGSGTAQNIVTRAFSQVYGFTGISDPKLIQKDPFLLMPAFFSSLPIPASHFSRTDGVLSFNAQGMNWILISGKLKGEALSLQTQEDVVTAFNQGKEEIDQGHKGVEVLRAGAVFLLRRVRDKPWLKHLFLVRCQQSALSSFCWLCFARRCPLHSVCWLLV